MKEINRIQISKIIDFIRGWTNRWIDDQMDGGWIGDGWRMEDECRIDGG